MYSKSLAEHYAWSKLVTTSDAARALELTPRQVRRLGHDGALKASETTIHGWRLYRQQEVLSAVEQRARARLRGVRVFRPKKLGVRGEPQQLALFVRLVPRPEADIQRADSAGK